jgi:hypothetical protein
VRVEKKRKSLEKSSEDDEDREEQQQHSGLISGLHDFKQNFNLATPGKRWLGLTAKFN